MCVCLLSLFCSVQLSISIEESIGDLEASIDRKRAALATPKKPGEEETEDLASPAPGSDDDYSEDLCVGAWLAEPAVFFFFLPPQETAAFDALNAPTEFVKVHE